MLALVAISEHERVVRDQVMHSFAAELAEMRVRAQSGQAPLESGSVARKIGEDEARSLDLEEEFDSYITTLLDICEQQPYAVHLYFYQRMASLLEPLAENFGTATPVETLEALITAYQANRGNPG